MLIELISFGFKHKNTPEANYLIDVRFLSNPFYIDELRNLTGLDIEVIKFFETNENVKSFLKELYGWVTYIVKANMKANKEKITIAIGCTGGQHRSTYLVETLSKYLKTKKIIDTVSIYHQNLTKSNILEPVTVQTQGIHN